MSLSLVLPFSCFLVPVQIEERFTTLGAGGVFSLPFGGMRAAQGTRLVEV